MRTFLDCGFHGRMPSCIHARMHKFSGNIFPKRGWPPHSLGNFLAGKIWAFCPWLSKANHQSILPFWCPIFLRQFGWRVQLFMGHAGVDRNRFSSISAPYVLPRQGNDKESCGIGVDTRTWCSEVRLREALHNLELMDQQGVGVHCDTFICLLQGCINMKALAEGKRVHVHITKHCPKPNISLSNTLINMYAKCGNVVDARIVFDKMHVRDVITWTVMIGGYAQQGHSEEAFKLFWQMQLEGMKPDKLTYISILKACVNLGALELGKQIHAHIIQSGEESDVFVGSTLVDMYAKCGSIEHAREVFIRMPMRNVVSWTAMIAGYAQHGYGEEAMKCFTQMEQEGVKPNAVTFVSILKVCASLGALEQGKQIHARIIKSGVKIDVFVGSTLVGMYAKCGSIKHARQVFDKMRRRNVVSWTAMIAGYTQHGHGKEALNLFRQMAQESVKPSKVTFLAILKACSNLGSLEQGRQIHSHIIRNGCESDVFVGSTLVDMYAKCGSLVDARQVLDRMPTRNAVAWNAMIAGYAQHGHVEEAFETFWQMQWEGVKPDKITFTSILKACTSPTALEQGKQIHIHTIKSGCELDVFVGSALVNMYAKCGSIMHACQVFEKMPRRDVVSWNAMIAGYAQHGHGNKALKAFQQMQKEGEKPDKSTFVFVLNACASLRALELGQQIHAHILKSGFESDIFVGNALIDMYAKCGSIGLAQQVFDKMPKRDTVSWTALIAGYAQKGYGEKSLKMFWLMQQEGLSPDNVTFASVLNGCATLGALDQGKRIHCYIINGGCEPDVFVESTLVNMYAKCGSIEQARQVFNSMSKRNVTSWNAMITGYAQHGHGEEALKIFWQMQQAGVKPNEVTFTSVMSACSHVGLVDEGQHCFDSMCRDHGITPTEEHYACMVGLLGRAGNLQEAEECIQNMPLQPSALVWMALLGASRIHGHVELAKHAAARILELEPQSTAASVLLSNVYAAAGRWDDKGSVRKGMEESGHACEKTARMQPY